MSRFPALPLFAALVALTGCTPPSPAPPPGSVLAPTPACSTADLEKAGQSGYERGYLAGRRYQEKLDAARPAPAQAPPSPVVPAPLPANPYTPSGPAVPVTVPPP